MSLQFSILKILAGQPLGRATVAELNRYITLLNVPEWTARMKRLSARAPDLDIFGSRYVLRDDAGWQLTEAGHSFLAAVEMPVPLLDQNMSLEVAMTISAPPSQSPRPPLQMVADNRRGRRRGRGKNRRANRSAAA